MANQVKATLPDFSLSDLWHPVPLSHLVYNQYAQNKDDLAAALAKDPTLKKDLVVDEYANLMHHVYQHCLLIEQDGRGKSPIDEFCANLARDIYLYLEQSGLRKDELEKFRAWWHPYLDHGKLPEDTNLQHSLVVKVLEKHGEPKPDVVKEQMPTAIPEVMPIELERVVPGIQKKLDELPPLLAKEFMDKTGWYNC